MCVVLVACYSRQGGVKRFGNMVLESLGKEVKPDATLESMVNQDTPVTKEQFKELITKVDMGLRALPATAQVGLWWAPAGCLATALLDLAGHHGPRVTVAGVSVLLTTLS